MALQTIPPRIRWAVDLMDVQPSDHVLEIGCGPGFGAELICERLETGKLFAIDRSESGVDRTKRRCAPLRRQRPAHRAPDRPGHAAGAGEAAAQGLRVQRQPVLDPRPAPTRSRCSTSGCCPGGAVYLFFDANRPELVPNIVRKASAALQEGGFRVSVVDQKAPPVVGIIGRR